MKTLIFPLLALAMTVSSARAEVVKNDGPRPVVQPNEGDGTLTFLAFDAVVHGDKAKLEKKGDNPHNIGYWTSDKDTVTWRAKLPAAGQYDVELEYSLAASCKGSVIAIELGEKEKVTVPLEAGKTFMDFKTATVGRVELPAGELTVTVRPLKKPGVAVMDLRKIVLRPAKK